MSIVLLLSLIRQNFPVKRAVEQPTQEILNPIAIRPDNSLLCNWRYGWHQQSFYSRYQKPEGRSSAISSYN